MERSDEKKLYSVDIARQEAERLKKLTGDNASSEDFHIAEEIDEAEQRDVNFKNVKEIFDSYGFMPTDFPTSSKIFHPSDLNKFILECSKVLVCRMLGFRDNDWTAYGGVGGKEVEERLNSKIKENYPDKNFTDLADDKYQMLKLQFQKPMDFYNRVLDFKILKSKLED